MKPAGTRILAGLALAAALGWAAAVEPTPAFGSDAQFLQSLEGSWRGRGSATIPGRSAAEKITCQVSNRFDKGDSALVVEGECASTQGKTRVSGRLVQKGETVSGTLINAFQGARMTKSSGSVRGDQLVVSSNFVDSTTGNLTRTRQVIRMGNGSFAADFFTFDNASGNFEPAGQIRFSAR